MRHIKFTKQSYRYFIELTSWIKLALHAFVPRLFCADIKIVPMSSKHWINAYKLLSYKTTDGGFFVYMAYIRYNFLCLGSMFPVLIDIPNHGAMWWSSQVDKS